MEHVELKVNAQKYVKWFVTKVNSCSRFTEQNLCTVSGHIKPKLNSLVTKNKQKKNKTDL
jgi:hypothetical protein